MLKHINAEEIAAVKITDTPRNASVTGYGPKIPTRYMLRIGTRWHRVYMAQYGNSGSAYIVKGGEDYYLSTDAEHMLNG